MALGGGRRAAPSLADLIGEFGHREARARSGLQLLALELALEQPSIASVRQEPEYGVGRRAWRSGVRVDEEEFLFNSHGANIHCVLLCRFFATIT
ncbi:hypothetical protein GCM10029978_005890 [Actinoallomurus acanthiterrae]